MSVLSSIGLSLGSSALSGLGNALFGGISAKRNWKYQQKQMALQQQYNMQTMAQEQAYNEANMAKQFAYQQQAWQMQNEYNDPSAVRERYEKAGIAPQAALGGGATGAGLADVMDTPSSQNPSGSSPSGSANYSGNAVDPMMLIQLSAQAALADKYKAEAERTRSMTFDNDFNRDVAQARMNADNASAALANAGVFEKNASARLTSALAEVAEATKNSNISLAQSKAKIAFFELAQGSEKLKQMQFDTEKQREEYEAQLNQVRASTYYMLMSGYYQRAQAMTVDALRAGVKDILDKQFYDKQIAEVTRDDLYARYDAWKSQYGEEMASRIAYTAMSAWALEYNATTQRGAMVVDAVNKSLQTCMDIAGAFLSRGASLGVPQVSQPQATIYGAGGNVIGPQGQLQGWNK